MVAQLPLAHDHPRPGVVAKWPHPTGSEVVAQPPYLIEVAMRPVKMAAWLLVG
jgi:hypothetical protein